MFAALAVSMIGIAKTLSNLSQEELDTILDNRDSGEFDKAWCEARELVPERESETDIESLFMRLSRTTNGHEICSYIVEDIELIENASKAGIESDFINYLRYTYTQLQVPSKWKS